MEFLAEALGFLITAQNWAGDQGIGARTLDHIGYTLLAVAVAAVLALPIGIMIGHSGRGANAVVALSGAMRALPSLGLLTWLALEMSIGVRMPVVPSIIVLVILAVPPIMDSTVAGFIAIPRDVVDSARASGFSEAHIVRAVELPLSAPGIIGGIRSATVQVIATATIVAYIGLSGLGRYLIDGLALRDYPLMLSGAILVALLALIFDLILAAGQKLAQPKGLMRS
ncbi:ABC transporter permease [Corynebacterium cystitidis]|uniref:ABC transporter permease n=1 Tax=Corynebacterium cystitidis TaxID=35757 RepID=UPI00211E2632|nr:ABC transporter permease [Corynebacterium cystitidis]